MDDDSYPEENIEIFNANFKCNDTEQIEYLYKFDTTVENNDIISKRIRKKTYNHPLFLNYNYCLFCLERRKTKYNQQNLNDSHNILDLKGISVFLEREKIKFQRPKNKVDKLSKRRFIHSYEHKNKNIEDKNKSSESDTELCVGKIPQESNRINNIKKFSFKSHKVKRSSKEISKTQKYLNSETNNKEDNSISKKYSKNNSKGKKIKTSIEKSFTKKDVTFRSLESSRKERGKGGILNSQNQNSDPRINSKNKNNPLNFFGIISDYFKRNSRDNEMNSSYMKQVDETEVHNLKYYEKNEKCGICLELIKEKFTLFCGDFFCKKCIVDLLKQSLNNILLFDKLKCPRCKEKINENIIKFLLNEEYLQKYYKLKTRIEGLKNPNNIPCPIPDCEGFSKKDEVINGTSECQNGHIFCNKCLNEVDIKYRLDPNNKHICPKMNEESEEGQTKKYFKENENIRKCPKCHCWGQREENKCNYFECPNVWCNYKFCWICGQKREGSHYSNPFSVCFGLSHVDYKKIKNRKIRRIRCILIFLLIFLILLPIIIIFFSFVIIFSFIMYFQFDGKELRNVRFHSKLAHKTFYLLYLFFIFAISLGLIPFGYFCLVLLLLAIPIIVIVNKIRKKSKDF